MSQLPSYSIDVAGCDWPQLLANWRWHEGVPAKFSPWLMNHFGELVFVKSDGSVHRLLLDEGVVEMIAADRDDFLARLESSETANEWLLIPLVDRCVEAGLHLQPGECYGFRHPVAAGGDYAIENVVVAPLAQRFATLGEFQRVLKE
ncbi:MAG TPA: T6SS immunity protein Tdi1 domain-containing protein, partial [Pirellulales bacterium]